jgi:hypothetical protein
MMSSVLADNLIGFVLVILDPNYGERLRQVWPGRPVWIAIDRACL